MTRGVLIVDDHAGFRALARELLESEGVEIVGEAHDGDGAIASVVALRPGLVLLDVNLPGDDGFVVAERLAALPGAPVVLLISSLPAHQLQQRVDAAPVAGFLDKRELCAAAITAIVG